MLTHSLLIGGFVLEVAAVTVWFYRKFRVLNSLRVKRVRVNRR